NISPKIAASSPPKQQAKFNKLTQSIHIADCRAVATHAASIETHVRVKIIALQRQSTIRSPSHHVLRDRDRTFPITRDAAIGAPLTHLFRCPRKRFAEISGDNPRL